MVVFVGGLFSWLALWFSTSSLIYSVSILNIRHINSSSLGFSGKSLRRRTPRVTLEKKNLSCMCITLDCYGRYVYFRAFLELLFMLS